MTEKAFATPLEMFHHWAHETPGRIFLSQRIGGTWRSWSYAEAMVEVRRVAAGLVSLNLPRKSHIAILSKNCAHWILADLAIWMAGHVSVSIYPTLSAAAIEQILEHSNTRVLFVGKLDNFLEQRRAIKKAIRCISFTPYGEKMGIQWDDLVAVNNPIAGKNFPLGSDLATIKYTSGTTGTAKGAMFSFDALSFAMDAIKEFQFDEGKQQRLFSYLPLAHVGERALVELGALQYGSRIYFPESQATFVNDLYDVKPTVFFAVPRIWEKFRDRICEQLPNIDKLLRIPVVRFFVKRKIRAKLGLSKAKWILTGAAPTSLELLEWFAELGITIRDVYGMTENFAYSHINLTEVRFGTVGKPWKKVQARLSADGEIQVKHPGLMMGYYMDPERTQAVFTADGYLRSGDKGVLDKDGFLIISGRIKDQFKTAKGKFIDPAPIEEKFLNLNRNIGQALVVGYGLPQPIVLITLTEEGKKQRQLRSEKSLMETMQRVNLSLEVFEQIKVAVVLDQSWTLENNLLTPTLKIKRHTIESIFQSEYAGWYRSRNEVVWHSEDRLSPSHLDNSSTATAASAVDVRTLR